MSIEKINVAVAKCDACGACHYTDDNVGAFTSGWEFTVTEHTIGGATVYTGATCRLTHLMRAVKAVMQENEDRADRDLSFATGGVISPEDVRQVPTEWGTP